MSHSVLSTSKCVFRECPTARRVDDKPVLPVKVIGQDIVLHCRRFLEYFIAQTVAASVQQGVGFERSDSIASYDSLVMNEFN